jgi:hypothetical protein
MDRSSFPLTFNVDYPDRTLDRVSTLFRIFAAIPILIVLGAVAGGSWSSRTGGGTTTAAAGAGGILFLGPLLMIVFRQKYPRWWFDWNLEFQRFWNRVSVYLLLMDDRYPSTDEGQSVHLDFPYPNVTQDLGRYMPLFKWFLAIPHYIVLFFLNVAMLGVTIIAWVIIVITGRYPRSMFDFVEGVLRWNNRLAAYAFILVTDVYPPFSLE